MLMVHIAGGTIALISGLVAMVTLKGSKPHRLAGKIYFWGMTAVFFGALVLAVFKQLNFLLMVAFFSYYMTVRGYRILYLKKLSHGQKAEPLDWFITIISGIFLLSLVVWGVWAIWNGAGMGIVAIAFSLIGLSFFISDVNQFFNPPKEKMHWWYGHITSMGGSYISVVTAFIVVNIQLPQFQWMLWMLPGIIGGIIIGRTIRKYKLKFNVSTAS